MILYRYRNSLCLYFSLEVTMKVHEKLQQIQTELKAPKGQFNKFGNYAYRSCEDILEALKPLLAKHQATVTISDEMVEVGGRVYVKATATFTDSESGEFVQTTGYAREAMDKKGMDDSQITGSTSSYARKYTLNGMFCIDDTKDADATNTHGKGDTTKKPQSTGTKSPQMASTDAVVFPSGKYAGQEVAKCSDKNYLKWVVENSTFNSTIKNAAKAAL